ncbi:hypothetical protein D3C85_1889610 [compost metagenome]
MTARQAEQRFHFRLVAAVTDGIGGPASACHKGKGINNNGFPGTCFPCQYMKSGIKMYVHRFNNGQIADRQRF